MNTDSASYVTKNVVVATGFYDIPNKINVKGEHLPKVSHYYKEDAHFYAFQKVVVVGASNSSVDAALEIYRKGGDVTLVIRDKEIGKRVKYWVKPDIENRIKDGSIKVLYNATVKEITNDQVVVDVMDEQISIDNDYVLALTGYMPNFYFLEKMGIQISTDERKIPKYDSKTMETNIKGIYLAGVICGGMETHKWFIENSRIHALSIMDNIEKA